MDVLSAIVLGFIQAVTEWLPLSSKTMDAIAYTQFLGGKPEGILPVLLFLHAGTMLAAAVYFRKELFSIAGKFISAPTDIKGHARGETGFIISSLVFTGVVGLPILLLETFVLPGLEAGALFSLMGAGLILTGFLLTTQRKDRWRKADKADWKDGMLTGAMQGLSAIPGISRAGATTTALVWRGFDAESAFHLSFVLSIPTVFCMEVVVWAARGGVSSIPIADGIMLAVSSFVFGYLTIGALIRIAQRINLAAFAFLFGIMMLAFGLFGLG